MFELVFVQLRDAEKRRQEDDEEDGQEDELRPKVHNPKKGEIHGDSVKERAYDGWRADVLGCWVFRHFGARADMVGMVSTVGLFARVSEGMITKGLGSIVRILRSDHHGEGVVDREGHESEHDRGHEKGLWGGVTFSNLEDFEPEEADSQGGDADDGAGKKEKHQEEENDVVNGEDFGGFDEYPIHRVEDIDVGEDVTTVGFANGVLGLVNAGEEHGYPNEDGDEHEEDTAKKLDGTEHSFNLDPCPHDPALTFSTCLGRQPLSADKSTFLADQGVEFTLVFGRKAILPTIVAALKLTLAFAILLKLRGDRTCKGWGRYRGSGLYESNGEEGETSGSIEDIDQSTNSDEKSQGKR